MLARSVLCRSAAKTSTHPLPQLVRLPRSTLPRNVLTLSAICALSRACKAALAESRRSYVTTARATKPTATAKKAVKKTAAKKATPKKAVTKKPKKKTAVKKNAKPKKKPAAKPGRVKKVPTPEQKEKQLIRELRVKALREPVNAREISGYNAFITERMRDTVVTPGDGLSKVALGYRDLTTAEKEHYNRVASDMNAARKKEYEAWVHSHTPDQIRIANLARARLRRLRPKLNGNRNHAHTLPIRDDRRLKSPSSLFARFTVERFSSGDFKGIVLKDAMKLIGNEWKALSVSEKKKYEDAHAADMVEYEREYERTYGHKRRASSPS